MKHIRKVDYTIEYTKKPFKTYSYLNMNSNHPFGVFKGIIKTECHRYMCLSCNKDEYNHMCNLFPVRLRRCEYKKHIINKHIIKYETKGNVKNAKSINLNQRTNGPVNAHLISWHSKAQNKQNLENIW